MKKLHVLFALLIISSILSESHARQLSMDEAFARINRNSFTRASSIGFPLYSKDQSSVLAYIFNINGKTVVASSDDRAVAVLGYLDSELKENDILPDVMISWLSEYSEKLPDNIIPSRTDINSGRDPIEPLLKTKWSQRYPYNILCPKDGDNNSATGCVATAMAQVMYYHRWPEKGSGYVKYYDSWLNREHEMDLNVTFDWDNMLLEYDATEQGSTKEQKDAVALLMKACGYSTGMFYSFAESGAGLSACSALSDYFGYSSKINSIRSTLFPLDKWEDVLYRNLTQCGPIIYTGSNDSGTKSHAFVCDGYKEDEKGALFHFNWGYGGVGDGYFRLSAMKPDPTTDYSFSHEAVLGIVPEKYDSEDYSFIVSNGLYGLDYCNTTKILYNVDFLLYSARTKNGCNVIVNTEIKPKNEIYSFNKTVSTLVSVPEWGQLNFFEVETPVIPDGEYYISATWRFENEDEDVQREIIYRPGSPTRFILSVSNGEAKVTNLDELLPTCESLEIKSPLYFSKPYHIEVKLRNDHDTEIVVNEEIHLRRNDCEQKVSVMFQPDIRIAPGETISLNNYNRIFPEQNLTFNLDDGRVTEFKYPVGNYTLHFGHFSPKTNDGFIDICKPFEVYIGEAPESTPVLVGSDFRFDVSHERIKAKWRVTCTQGYFASKLVCSYGGGNISGWIYTDAIYLKEGDSTECEMDFSNAIPYLWEGANFNLRVEYDPNADLDRYDINALIPLMEEQQFKFSNVQSPSNDNNISISVTDDGIVNCNGNEFNVFSVSGMVIAEKVSTYRLPSNGIYIISSGKYYKKIRY